jgi:hypothetical protein
MRLACGSGTLAVAGTPPLWRPGREEVHGPRAEPDAAWAEGSTEGALVRGPHPFEGGACPVTGSASPAPSMLHALWDTAVGSRAAPLPGLVCGPCPVALCGRAWAVSGGGVGRGAGRLRGQHARPPCSPRGCRRNVSQARWRPCGARRCCQEARRSRRACRGAEGCLHRGASTSPRRRKTRRGQALGHAGRVSRQGECPRRRALPIRPLTSHWSRRQQPPLVPRSGCRRGSPRALDFWAEKSRQGWP